MVIESIPLSDLDLKSFVTLDVAAMSKVSILEVREGALK